uniref:PNPLA domain-containing protein n=1 Tax=viral metagenome TaxID=1070528 RepID=A0A6C0JJ44_9ZZZZ
MSEKQCNVKLDPSVKSGETKIRHLVISGGAISGLTFYGTLQKLHKQNYWKIENIQTIYGTSVGSFIAVIIALGYEWSEIDNYFIKRPWQHIFKIDTYSMIDSLINKMGIYNNKIFEDALYPLFAGKDIPIGITLKEFYELNGIEIHIFTTELNSFTLTDMSYKTHGDWRVIDVIYCSCCLPVIFMPFLREARAYGDGGFLSNYPLIQCIENGADASEILGVYRIYSEGMGTLSKESNIFDYLMVIFNQTIEKIVIYPKLLSIGIECALEATPMTIGSLHDIISNHEERKRIIDMGANFEV